MLIRSSYILFQKYYANLFEKQPDKNFTFSHFTLKSGTFMNENKFYKEEKKKIS
jgi:hypothetical protein